jgi:hypothetical protein
MPRNNKKEYPKGFLENATTSKVGRKQVGILKNNPELVKFAKKQIIKRFRRRKDYLLNLTEEEEDKK